MMNTNASSRCLGWMLVGLVVWGLATATLALGPPEIFSDDFESGSASAWSESSGCGDAYLMETFPLDGIWGGDWVDSGGVANAEVVLGRAFLRPVPTSYSLARVNNPLMGVDPAQDVDVAFTVAFEDISTQGVGFYVRHNGGYLNETVPPGAGYAVFIEGFRSSPGIGVWREVNGSEQSIEIFFDDALGFVNGVDYRVRFRVQQQSPTTTLLRAKIWPVAGTEPAQWMVEANDSTPSLQLMSGGVAVDSWSSIDAPNPITASTIVDDIQVLPLCESAPKK